MTTPTDNRRDLLTVIARMHAKPGKEQELREANKSLWQRVYDATVGLIQKILAFKNLLLSVLAIRLRFPWRHKRRRRLY